MFDQGKGSDGGRVPIPFGRGDCTVFRKVMSTEDTIQEFDSALRTDSQAQALRLALQVLGDLCGFGISYFDFDNSGYVKTATEVSSDNSASCATCASTRTRCRRDRQHEPGTSGLFPCARRRHSGRRLRAGAV